MYTYSDSMSYYDLNGYLSYDPPYSLTLVHCIGGATNAEE